MFPYQSPSRVADSPAGSVPTCFRRASSFRVHRRTTIGSTAYLTRNVPRLLLRSARARIRFELERLPLNIAGERPPAIHSSPDTRNQDVSDPLMQVRERTPGSLTSWL